MTPQLGRRLRLSQLFKRFGDTVALDGVSFAVEPGEIFGFCGSNGAGKTTTMRIALGVLAADSGLVEFDDAPITDSDRRHIGYMAAERGLYPKMTPAAQLAFFARLHGLSSSDASAATRQWASRLQFEQHLDDPVEKLSTGNKQRVQLATALVHNPQVLVLDEPFSGLDPLAAEVVSEVLVEVSRSGVPVLFSSHQLDLVEQLSHRVGIIEAGVMRAVGTIEELRRVGGDQIEMRVGDMPSGWASSLPGVTVDHESAGHAVVRLADGADDQLVLRAALERGPVHEFSRRRARLAELYRDVVVG
jgi:ABC-2 type transport system ATP-binding protein